MTSTASIPITDLTTTVPPPIETQLSQTHILPPPFQHSNPLPQLLTQGAEALVYKTTFLSSSMPAALKYRPSKPYRHPTLDARLTKARVLAEARVLVRLSGFKKDGIAVPAVLSLEWDVGRKVKGLNDEQKSAVVETRGCKKVGSGFGAWLLMEWIEGKSLKQILREWDAWYKAYGHSESPEAKEEAELEVKKLLRQVGRAVAAMHNSGGVIHGDLTSSNIMVRPVTGQVEDDKKPPNMNGEIVLIDFGLATQSVQEEDRAVDLYVLERAFGSTHPRQEDWFDQEVLQSEDGYRGAFKASKSILRRLDEVRMRGRKRTMIG